MFSAALPGRQDANISRNVSTVGSLGASPRYSYLQDVGNRTIATELHRHNTTPANPAFEAQNTLSRVFSSHGEVNMDELRPLEAYLQRMALPSGHVLWRQFDAPDGLYIIETGVLRATYQFADHTRCVEESMVAGTIAGEMSALSDLPRNATVVVEQPAVVWKLSTTDLRRLEAEQPQVARTFIRFILKGMR